MIFIDTNVIVDLAISERPFHLEAKSFFEECARRNIELSSSVLCLGTFCYLLESKAKLKHKEVKEWLHKLTKLIMLIPTENTDARQAAFSSIKDTEDAILYFTAVSNECDAFITQNTKDFPRSLEIPVFTPDQMTKELDEAD
ncbi:MAG: type II toxin-antitoxin system VapC family toxin [Cytophagales bacterium]|nr:type II toxin-antitoxin system VapC family toxin [Cytophagales bacterium]